MNIVWAITLARLSFLIRYFSTIIESNINFDMT